MTNRVLFIPRDTIPPRGIYLFTTEIRKRLYIPLSYIFAFIYSFFALGLNIFKLAWFEIRYSQEIGGIYRNVSIHRGVVEDRSEDVLDPCVSIDV